MAATRKGTDDAELLDASAREGGKTWGSYAEFMVCARPRRFADHASQRRDPRTFTPSTGKSRNRFYKGAAQVRARGLAKVWEPELRTHRKSAFHR